MCELSAFFVSIFFLHRWPPQRGATPQRRRRLRRWCDGAKLLFIFWFFLQSCICSPLLLFDGGAREKIVFPLLGARFAWLWVDILCCVVVRLAMKVRWISSSWILIDDGMMAREDSHVVAAQCRFFNTYRSLF